MFLCLWLTRAVVYQLTSVRLIWILAQGEKNGFQGWTRNPVGSGNCEMRGEGGGLPLALRHAPWPLSRDPRWPRSCHVICPSSNKVSPSRSSPLICQPRIVLKESHVIRIFRDISLSLSLSLSLSYLLAWYWNSLHSVTILLLGHGFQISGILPTTGFLYATGGFVGNAFGGLFGLSVSCQPVENMASNVFLMFSLHFSWDIFVMLFFFLSSSSSDSSLLHFRGNFPLWVHPSPPPHTSSWFIIFVVLSAAAAAAPPCIKEDETPREISIQYSPVVGSTFDIFWFSFRLLRIASVRPSVR